MNVTLAERVEALLAPVAQREGLELVAVETAGATKHPVIRVLLDCEGGITLDVIVAANRWISEVLDAEDPIPSTYTLEVSSPGVDRPLRTIADFERFIGHVAVVKTTPIEGRARFTGEIVGTDESSVTLDVDGETVRVPIGAVSKARLKGEVDFARKGATE